METVKEMKKIFAAKASKIDSLGNGEYEICYARTLTTEYGEQYIVIINNTPYWANAFIRTCLNNHLVGNVKDNDYIFNEEGKPIYLQ